MCNFKTLHHNAHGYVVKCKSCGHLQVGFGTTAIVYSPEDFKEMHLNLLQCYHCHKNTLCPELKSINFQQLAPNVMTVYNLRELEQLIELIEMAALRIEVEKTLSENRN